MNNVLDAIAEKAVSLGLGVYTVAAADEHGIYERCVNVSDQCTNSYSVAKAFTVTAIGMLYDQKIISVDDRVLSLLGDEIPDKYDERWEEVTVENLLTHRVGFGRGLLDIDVDDITLYGTDDFVRLVLSEPLAYKPGTRFQYTDAAFYLLSVIVTKITGMRLDDFLRPVLFGTLGFRELAWSVCPRGFCMGATGLYLRTSDMVKLGYVYANSGKYGGKTVVSEEWVRLVLERGYEFGKYKGTRLYAKGGMYGQMLCFSPGERVAFAFHAYENKKDTSVLLRTIEECAFR